MKHINKHFSIFAGILFFALIVGVFVHANSGPSVTVTSTVLPAFESQPSAQSSGLPVNILGIPTGNDATTSPLPNIDFNRCGPNMVLGFGQVVYDQADLVIKGRDEVTNLVIGRRHLSRRDQTQTLVNEVYSSVSLQTGVTYQWVDASGSPDFSNLTLDSVNGSSSTTTITYTVGDTFKLATGSSVTPTSWGTAAVQLAEQTVDKHSVFGPAWAFNYSHTITRYGDDVLMDSYGRRDRFTKVSENVWEGSVGRFDRLTYDSTSAKYSLRMPHGTSLEFEADDSATGKPAHLTKIISPNTQNTLQFTYETAATTPEILERKLLSITDSFGRSITLTYNDADYAQGASSITDFSGRTVEYDYDSMGRLISTRSPTVSSLDTLNDFANGKTYNYQYLDSTVDGLSLALTAVIAPNQVVDGTNTPYCQWTYDENVGSINTGASASQYLGYVKTFTLGDGTFSYNYRALASFSGADSNKPVREVKVTDRMGTVTVYKTNCLGQVLSEEVTTADRSYTKSYQYNSDGQLTKADDAMGSRAQYFYTKRREIEASDGSFPNIDNTRNMEFPLTDVFRIPDARGADQEFIRNRNIYEPIYNKPFQMIDPRAFESVDGETDQEKAARIAKYTTTYSYDYMEDLDNNKTDFADLMGVADAAALTNLLPTGLEQIEETNGDGGMAQTAGNVIHVQHPDVTVEDLPNVDEAALGATTTASETFTYNGFGQITRYQDAEDNITTYSYFDASGAVSADGGGYLQQIIADAEPGGDSANPIVRTTTYEYIAQTTSLEPGSSVTVTFPENPRGVPTAIIDPRGVKTVYYVNELDQVVKSVLAAAVGEGSNPEAGLSEFAYESQVLYDANNNIIEKQIENEDGLDPLVDDMIVHRNTYDILNQVDNFVLDGDGDDDPTTDAGEVEIRAEFAYDANQNLIDIKRGDASNTAYDEYSDEGIIYDERDLPQAYIIGEEEPEEASFEQQVDANGQVIVAIDGEDADANDADDGVEGGDPTKIIYDGFNRKKEVIDREGNRTVYTYDSASNLISVQVYGPLEGESDDVLLEQIDISYDERNRFIRSDQHLFQYEGQVVGDVTDVDSDDGDGLVSEYILYDGLDRPVGVLDGEGDFVINSYDGLSRVVSIEDAEGNETEYDYDPNGNVIDVGEFELKSDDSSTTPESFASTFTYDALNRLVSSVEPNGQDTTYVYDSRGNLIRTTDDLGNVVEMTYDRVDRLIQKDSFLASNGRDASSSNLDAAQSGDGKITVKTEWDDLGRAIARIDDNGARVEYTYDDLGRRVRSTYEDNSTEEWTYNDDSDVIEYKDRNGTIITRTFDAESRLISETSFTEPGLGLEIAGTTARSWTYDGLDRIISAFDDNGMNDDVTCIYIYDSQSRQIRETQRINGSNDLSVDTGWEGASGHKIKTVYPNGRIINRSYDDSSRLATITEPGATQSQIAAYIYIGQFRTVETAYGNGAVQTRTFDTNRRTTVNKWQKSGSDITNYAYTYNATNRIASEDRQHLGASNNIDSYTFDSAYRMTGFREDGSDVGIGGMLSSRNLNGADMMIAFSDDGVDQSPIIDGNGAASLNRYTEFNGKSRIFDDNGSLDDANSDDLTDSSDLEFVQDYLNRIVEVQDGNDSVIAQYVYDSIGRRVLKIAGGTTTRYLYDGWQVLEERDYSNDSVLRQYVDGRDIDEHVQIRVFATDNTSSDYYYHCNEPGFVGALTDSNGAAVEYYEYEWLGEAKVLDATSATVSESTVGNPYAFQGRRLDTETGLYYYRNRYYSPTEGQFITVDPLGVWNHGQGNGRSAFSEDPINNRDPFGLDDKIAVNAISSAIDDDDDAVVYYNTAGLTNQILAEQTATKAYRAKQNIILDTSKIEAGITMEFARANNWFSYGFVNFKQKMTPEKFGLTKEQRLEAKKWAPYVRDFINEVKEKSPEFKKALAVSVAANSTHYGLAVANVGATVASIATAGAAVPVSLTIAASSQAAKATSGVADLAASKAVAKLVRVNSIYGRHTALRDQLKARGRVKLSGAALGGLVMGASAGAGITIDALGIDNSVVTGSLGAGIGAASVASRFGGNLAINASLNKGKANLDLVDAVKCCAINRIPNP